MKNVSSIKKNSLKVRKTVEGETIEHKIRRITTNNEPIKDGAPIVYTERKDGVKPEFNIRSDRFDIAVEAMDSISKTKLAKREERIKAREPKNPEPTEPGKVDVVKPISASEGK